MMLIANIFGFISTNFFVLSSYSAYSLILFSNFLPSSVLTELSLLSFFPSTDLEAVYDIIFYS